MKSGDNFDQANEVLIESCELIGGHPQFAMVRATDDMLLITRSERRIDSETSYVANVAGCFVLRIPIARDLNRIGLREDRIEEGLMRQPRRECTPSTLRDQLELLLADWAIESFGGLWRQRALA